jgi:hypothetical protein
MLDLSRQAGVAAALRDFSAAKFAGFFGDVLSSARTQAFGHPLEALKQIRSGTLFHPETGLYSKGLPNSLGSLTGSLAVPLALTALFAHSSPEGQRGEVVGDMVGRTMGSVLGGPLAGVAGQIGGGMLLSNVGRSLGRQFDTSASPGNAEVAVED